MRSVEARGDAREVAIEVPADLRRYIASKGSVTLDGVSLTVNEVDATGFFVGLVPHTLAATTFGALAPGDRLNLEVDVVARYVARLLGAERDPAARAGGIDLDLLREAGFAPGGPRGERA